MKYTQSLLKETFCMLLLLGCKRLEVLVGQQQAYEFLGLKRINKKLPKILKSSCLI